MVKGKVYLIGAGPGDPGLLTLKGKECLERAEVVLYDALVDPGILDFARPQAKKIFVGKRGGKESIRQSQLNRMLVSLAKSGKSVARLKGGDPFIFGRGGEEAEFLVMHKVAFEVVPGVTSAIAAPAYAGIPLTHRRHNSSVTFVTGHTDGEGKGLPVEWGKISPRSTLVVLMGVENLGKIVEELLHRSWDPQTPAALVRRGTTAEQETLVSDLSEIVEKTRREGLAPPAVLVVGNVVSLRGKLRWFDTQPLFGKTVLITRAREQASEFAQKLMACGARVLQFPTIRILPPRDFRPLDRALSKLSRYDWLIFTSQNGVESFVSRLRKLRIKLSAAAVMKTCVIGPKTAERMTALGLRVDKIAKEYRAESILPELGFVRGKRILIPGARVARDILPKELLARGARVDAVDAYETLKDSRGLSSVKKMLLKGGADVITFTASSTVRNFMSFFSSRQRRRIFKRAFAACIGPVTAETVKSFGVRPKIIAKEYTVDGLVQALVEHYR